MSATNRGGQRREADYYPTPVWCVHRLLEAAPLPGGVWAEPCVGDGAILRAIASSPVRPCIRWWHTNDIRPVSPPPYPPGADGLHPAQGCATERGVTADGAIPNPPVEVYRWCREHATATVLLQRVNWLGSAKRLDIFRNDMPDVYVMPNRPSFDGRGTDAADYAWFVWPDQQRRRSGRVEVLAETPKGVRAASRAAIRARLEAA